MRLTLRTLLAYLDDLLEPSDAKDIGQRIEESEFATSIINRIHDCMRRLRLGVPPLSARGTGGDANTVAEYLDNSMAPDLVPEFERVCLESDVHLAEVAASHQILTLVLGEPAEIDPASRHRMYRLLYEPDAGSQPASAVAPEGAAATAAPRTSRQRPQVPDYLRETTDRGEWLAIGAVGVAALVLIASALYLFWPQDTEVAQVPAQAADEAAAAADDDAAPDAAAEAGDTEPDEMADEPTDLLVDTEVPDSPDAVDADLPAVVAAPEVEAGDRPTEIAVEAPAPGDLALDGELPAAAIDVQEEVAEPVADDPVAAEEVASSAQVGRFVSEGQILLRRVAPDDWSRLPAREVLMAGDQVVSLPGFRSIVALTSGVTAQILGATQVRLYENDDQGVPELEIEQGRVLFMSSGQPNARVRLRAGDQTATLTLVEASSLAGVEVYPFIEPGADQPELSTLLFVGNGAVKWEAGEGGAAQTVAAPAIQTWAGERPPEVAVEDLPSWLAGDHDLSDADRRAANLMNSNMGTDRSARLGLLELANDRRFEVKSLAVRSLGLLDEFEPLIDALGDSMQRSAWDRHIEVLYQARARGDETADKLQQAIQERRPVSAEQLYRMLSGYSDEDLQQGEAAQLVANLDSQDLAVRVLANWNLEQITGERSRYRPQDPPNLRQPQVRRWKAWAEQIGREAQAAAGVRQ